MIRLVHSEIEHPPAGFREDSTQPTSVKIRVIRGLTNFVRSERL